MRRRLRSFCGGTPHRGGISASSAAFSLLEVMVAVAILGLGLTVILTAQTGLFSSAKRAAQLSQAVGLARNQVVVAPAHQRFPFCRSQRAATAGFAGRNPLVA